MMKQLLSALLLFAVVFLLATCGREEPIAPQATNASKAVSLQKVAEGQYVLTAETWQAAQDAAVKAAGGVVSFKHAKTGIGVVTSANPKFLEAALASKVFSGGAQDLMVEWQPPIRTMDLQENLVTPGDETFINLQWNILAIDARGAWAAGYTGAGVRVAVVDGGLWNTHVDLVGNVDVARSTSFVPGFAFNQDVGTFWHGTHVAGIVAAKDNGIGTIGVAPGATIVGVKALHNGSGSFGAIISGILYAATPVSAGGGGADIINLSLGAIFARGGGNTGAGLLVAALNKAVNYAGNTALVVCAAGNNAVDLDHSGSVIFVPAMSGSGIAVSATGPVGFAVNYPNGATNYSRPASYTNYGNSLVWVAAPGGDFALPGNDLCTLPRVPSGSVTVPCWVYDMVMSTVRGSGASTSTYSWAAGTSMAAPAVCGVAALVKEKFPGISVGALKNKLAQTADDEGAPGHDPFYGRGFINARRAVTE